jgi:hypothetical protein
VDVLDSIKIWKKNETMVTLVDKDCETRRMSSVEKMGGRQPKDSDAYTTIVESAMASHSFVWASTTIHHYHYVFANELSLGAEHIKYSASYPLHKV